jgi:hypothetical protein
MDLTLVNSAVVPDAAVMLSLDPGSRDAPAARGSAGANVKSDAKLDSRGPSAPQHVELSERLDRAARRRS